MGEGRRQLLKFGYRASTATGSVEHGAVTADSLAAAEKILRSKRLFPLEISEIQGESDDRAYVGQKLKTAQVNSAQLEKLLRKLEAGKSYGRSAKSITSKDILRITNDLGVLLTAKLPLDRGLSILIESSSDDSAVRTMLMDLLESIKAGKSFSSALRKHPNVFSGLYVNMVKAGEASGRLAEAMSELAAYFERLGAIRQSVSSAMTYPAILLVVSILSVTIMLGVVVPEFEAIFEDISDSLPILTRALLAVGDFVSSNLILLLLTTASLCLLLLRWWTSPTGRVLVDRLLLGSPLLGPVLLKSEITSFTDKKCSSDKKSRVLP